MTDKKVAIITGGSSGIGRATAVAFAREGVRVVIAARRAKESQETLKLVMEAGGEGIFVRTDVTIENDVKSLVEKTVNIYGRLDYAFNNAGMVELSTPLPEGTLENFDKIMDVNVKGVWLSMKYEIPQMLKNKGGVIVNSSSSRSLASMVEQAPVYFASKHAVIGLTKSAALDYAKHGIRVNAIAPGPIKTDMLELFLNSIKQSGNIAYTMPPIGRIGKPEEAANAVVWLCSDKASFISGHTLLVDGGVTIPASNII